METERKKSDIDTLVEAIDTQLLSKLLDSLIEEQGVAKSNEPR